MRVSTRILGLLALGTSLAGCSQTGGIRAVAPSDVKTTASVGDKPLSVVAGRPGEDRRAEADIPDLPRTTAARLSGRVFDDEGTPVRNAVVRLAMTGAAGGKAVHAVTDRSGAFTLRGVRPGSTYTVVAEYQGDQGVLTGRADADAPDTDVRISLRPRDAALNGDSDSGAEEVAATPRRSRVKPIAKSEEFDDADVFGEDEPVAAAPRPVRPRLDPVVDEPSEPEASEPEPFWSAQGSSRREKPAEPPPVEDDYEAGPGDVDDDGENPLPPARDISQVSARVEDDPPPPDIDDPTAEAPRSLPDGVVEGDREHRYGPVILDDPDPFPTEPVKPRPRARNSRRPIRSEAPTAESSGPTWSDVVSEHRSVPIDEALAQTTATATVAAKPVSPEPVPTSPPVETVAARADVAKPARAAKAARPKAPAREGPYCDFDFDERRMIDFAFHDMDGKLVSIRDFDADLILLDFWGSWCAPCRTSIPHLKELQERLGGRKLQVVSLAYEQTKPDDRTSKLKEVVRSLGINYPVLVRGYQEECPVFDALQIQFLPTMILLDREGRILRREQGATETTLAKIDKAIAENLDGGAKTYARRMPIGRTTR